MSEKLIGEMNDSDFEKMIGAFIDRPTNLDDEIPAELVFAMLAQQEKSTHVLDLDSTIVKDRLVISAAPNATMPANVREIELNLPHVRFIFKVELVPA